MKKQVVLMLAGLLMSTLAVISCRRSDVCSIVINVPQMSDERSIRIITNAALDEIVGQYDGMKNDCEIDLAKQTVLYHEGQRLLSTDYLRHIEACIGEVGLNAHAAGARLDPPPLVPTVDGPVQEWPNRYTVVISVPGMKSVKDANVVVDAIAYARLGRDDPRITVSRESRTITATYESMALSLKNIEYAIACAGFEANDSATKFGTEVAIPHGWRPVTLKNPRA
jgi:hypothetical protein